MFETLTRTKRARGVLFRPPQRRGPAKLRQRVTRALIKSVRVGSRLHVVWRYFTSENMFLGAGRMPHKKHNPAKCSEHKKWHAFWTENVLETENTYQCKLLGCSETPLEKEANGQACSTALRRNAFMYSLQLLCYLARFTASHGGYDSREFSETPGNGVSTS